MNWKDKLHHKIINNWDIGEEFMLEDVYKFEEYFRKQYPNNKTVRASIRRNLQKIRDDGNIKFLGEGKYKRVK
ncbi:MAG: hypothetical protein ACOCP8_07975 [archaeon]